MAIPILGQKNRQQRREEARAAGKDIDAFMTETANILNQVAKDNTFIHQRINTCFEALKLLGATPETLATADANAKEAVKAMLEAKMLAAEPVNPDNKEALN